MRQLGQLQDSYDDFRDLNTEVVAVFREEQKGAEGLQMARERTEASFPMGLDLGAEQTAEYSPKGFSTYIIGADGTIKAVFPGTKMIRPSAEKILESLQGIAGPSGDSQGL